MTLESMGVSLNELQIIKHSYLRFVGGPTEHEFREPTENEDAEGVTIKITERKY